MLKSQIKVGGLYRAKVAGKLTTVRVDAIREVDGYQSQTSSHSTNATTRYDVTNTATGRKTTFRSAAKFRREVGVEPKQNLTAEAFAANPPPKPHPSMPVYFGDGPDGSDPLRPTEAEARAARDVERRKTDCPTCGGFGTMPKSQGGGRCQVCDGTGKKKDEVDQLVSIVGNLTEDERQRLLSRLESSEAEDTTEGEQRSDPTTATQRSATSQRAYVGGSSEGEQGSDPITPADFVASRSRTAPVQGSGAATRLTGQSSTTSSVNKAAGGLANKLKAVGDVQPTAPAPHLIVTALAGTGKTTTLVEGISLVLTGRTKTPGMIPSPQQQAVWDLMRQGPRPRTVCFVAFNRSIAYELKDRVPNGCDASTMHSLGFKAVCKVFGRVRVDEHRVNEIVAKLLGMDIRSLRKTKMATLQATEKLVALCKQNLVIADDMGGWQLELDKLASHYEVEFEGADRREVYDLIPQVLERCLDVAQDNCIDYNDMVWLPVALNLPVFRYDLLLVDEAQDLNRCQQSLTRKAGDRIILCGDPNQAIYGFAGADAESMPRMEQELGQTGRGCVTLPLTVTRRCGKAIVREAQQYVPEFEAHESNGEGTIAEALYPIRGRGKEEVPWEKTYAPMAGHGDFILCRVNAPLVSQCLRFLKRNIRATIQGRDIGQGLVSLVKKLWRDGYDAVNFFSRLDDWLADEQRKESSKRNPSESKLIAIQDRHDCLTIFASDLSTGGRDTLIKKIETLFTDNKDEPGIRLSSIHKAKGLESRRVFFLRPADGPCPHPMAKSPWQQGQERNLCYVAITRAIEELVYVY